MNKKGFTIIELLTVIAILGILVLLAAPKFLGYTEQAKLAQIKNDVKSHEVQLSMKLTEEPSYLQAGNQNENYSCAKNYFKEKGPISGEDLIEVFLFSEDSDYSREDVIEGLLSQMDYTYKDVLYNKKGLVGKEDVEELVDGGALYHILPNNVVKSKLPGIFLASQNGDVLYLSKINRLGICMFE